jgi:cytoskeleton-associated protein 5
MLENYIDAMLYHFEDVLGYLKIKLKDWREANLSINKELFAMLIYANDLDPKPFT